MTSAVVEEDILFDILADLGVPCDYANEQDCPKLSAAWVLHLRPCCPEAPKARLACDVCKDNRMQQHYTVSCHECGHVFPHAPEAYHLIEPLNRRA